MRVNLMLDVEQRSASPVSLVMVIRTLVGTLILVALLLVTALFTSYRALQKNVSYADAAWKQTQPKYLAALQLRSNLTYKITTLNEIQGWRKTRVAWGKELENIEAVVPSMVQLTELRVAQELLLTSNNIPARVFELRLVGRTGAIRSEENVSELQSVLAGQPPFDTLIETASIPPGSFRQDPVNKADRVFEIVCKCRPKLFQ